MAKYESRRSFLTKTATAAAGLSFGLSALNAALIEGQLGTENTIQLKRKEHENE